MDRVVAIPQGHVPWKRAALCAMLALVVVGGWGQTTKRGTKEGTLVVNYYSTAPDPELEQLRQLAIDALGIHLRGEVLLSNEDIGWRRSPKSLQKEMSRIVTDLLSIRNFEGVEPFRGFSVDVLALLTDFEELDRRDVERMRGDSGKSFEARLYILIEQRIQEVLLLAGVEMGRFVNQGLLQQVGSVEQTLPTEALGEWMQFEEGAPLTPLEVDFSLETMSLLNRNDESTWPTGTGSLVQGSQDKGDEALMAMMAQIVDLLARQDERLRALEDKQLGDWARQGINPQRTTTAEDPVLSKLNLPASFDVQFYEGKDTPDARGAASVERGAGIHGHASLAEGGVHRACRRDWRPHGQFEPLQAPRPGCEGTHVGKWGGLHQGAPQLLWRRTGLQSRGLGQKGGGGVLCGRLTLS